MKRWFSLLLVLMFNNLPVLAASAELPTTDLGIEQAVMPRDLISQADAVITVAGTLRGCDTWESVSITNESPFFHTLAARAKQRGLCIGVKFYTHEVNLGRLQPGVHTLRIITGSRETIDQTFEVK
jgi:hypothetical protein